MSCRLIVTLPVRNRGRDVEAVYEDVGELEVGSSSGLKALYSDARKGVAVVAGIGAYLYTSLQPVVLPIGPEHRQVQARPGSGGDELVLSAATEEWLRDEYARQVRAEPVRRDLGEILAHGEPERGTGTEESAAPQTEAAQAREVGKGTETAEAHPQRNGLVVVDFRGPGPDAA